MMTNPRQTFSGGFSRRAFLGLGVGAVSAAALSACGAGGTAPATGGAGSASGAGGGALTVLCEAGGQAELTPVADAFTKETGTKITFVALPYDGLYNRFNTELSAGTPSFDIGVMDAIWLPTFAGKLTPLDDMFTDQVKADLFPSLLTEGQINGKYMGMPVWANAEIIFYRTDLFEDSKEKSNFKSKYGYELAAPTTWKQFDDIAQFFTRGSKLYGTDLKGAVETEWLAAVVQAGAAGPVLDPRQGDHRRRCPRCGAGLLQQLEQHAQGRTAGRGPGRLGGGAEPVQPRQDRNDPILGTRLPANPQRRSRLRQGRCRSHDRWIGWSGRNPRTLVPVVALQRSQS